MILLDRPYVSQLLIDTIIKNEIPVLETEYVRHINESFQFDLIGNSAAQNILKSSSDLHIYSNSENSIDWISQNLGFTDLPEKIRLFKDKVLFRKLIQEMFPDFFYEELKIEDLDTVDITSYPDTFIIKPSVGFFSVGVHKVSNRKEWHSACVALKNEVKNSQRLYPKDVIDSTTLIVEEYIEGREFAIDAYFNRDGEPVVLNILEHLFSSGEDVSDRIYISSKNIIEENLEKVTLFLQNIGEKTSLKSFPVHVEMRVDSEGVMVPIEINPMRFGGWCSTPDMTWFAYGINPYEYYFFEKRPDWDSILKEREDFIYSVIILDNSTGYNSDQILEFHYSKVLDHLENPLEVRRLDYRTYPVFGFIFAETHKDNIHELEYILKSDLSEFVDIIK